MQQILLYYKYTSIDDPQIIRDQQFELGTKLGLTGRILVSYEGLNGTVGGSKEAVEAYKEATEQLEGFSGIEWKESTGPDNAFPKLSVKVRDEIVTLGLMKKDHDVELKHKAPYIEPQDLLDLYENDEEFYIIDARNSYEMEVGKFKNALDLELDNFRDWPEKVKELEHLKDKAIVTYCTGGVRCEKASAYLVEQGFSNVRQLHGGIQRYGDTVGGKHFEGEMFVFDQRLSIPVNTINPTVVGKCTYCETPTSHFVDCSDFACGSLFLACEACEEANVARCPKCLEGVGVARV